MDGVTRCALRASLARSVGTDAGKTGRVLRRPGLATAAAPDREQRHRPQGPPQRVPHPQPVPECLPPARPRQVWLRRLHTRSLPPVAPFLRTPGQAQVQCSRAAGVPGHLQQQEGGHSRGKLASPHTCPGLRTHEPGRCEPVGGAVSSWGRGGTLWGRQTASIAVLGSQLQFNGGGTVNGVDYFKKKRDIYKRESVQLSFLAP